MMNSSGASLDTLAVFLSHYGMIVAVAGRYVPLPDLVQDVVQQCFIEFAEKVESGQWSLREDCGPGLRQLAKFRAINIWRSQREHLPDYQQTIADRLLQRVQDRNEEIGSSEREIKALEFCLQNLSASSRRFIERHYFEGQNIESIALENKLNPGSLRQAFCRIRTKLKSCIEKALNIDIEE